VAMHGRDSSCGPEMKGDGPKAFADIVTRAAAGSSKRRHEIGHVPKD
jgi:hypothetical protein